MVLLMICRHLGRLLQVRCIAGEVVSYDIRGQFVRQEQVIVLQILLIIQLGVVRGRLHGHPHTQLRGGSEEGRRVRITSGLIWLFHGTHVWFSSATSSTSVMYLLRMMLWHDPANIRHMGDVMPA